MPRDGSETRERILNAAQTLVMKQGFSATSVDQIQGAAEISRGTFFYHFPSKDDLARVLIERYAAVDDELTNNLMEKAERLARDPLQQALLFLGLHDDIFREMAGGETFGCLFASYSYEAGLFDSATHDLIESSVDHWRETLGGKLEEAFALHPPAVPTDPYEVADLGYSVLQGAFIMSRVRGDILLMIEHLKHYRLYLELLCGAVGGGAERTEAASTTASDA